MKNKIKFSMHYLPWWNNIFHAFLLLSASSWVCSAQSEEFSPSEYDLEYFTTKVEERIFDLEEKIKIISNKDYDVDRKLDAIDAAITSFESENNIFQVSSKQRAGVREYRLREYLNHLRVLPYIQVNIDWYDAVWVTNLRKDRNGIWRGTVRIFQKFEGFGPEGVNQYSDITKKDIPVAIEVLEVQTGDGNKKIVRVLLGDVRVSETI